jgi:hypothetical protein
VSGHKDIGKALRKAFGNQPGYVKTVEGWGFKLKGDIKRITPNPFSPFSPVQPEFFIGREPILSKLVEYVEGPSHLRIVGGPKIGKTSLLFKLNSTLSQELPVGRAGAVPAYLDSHDVDRKDGAQSLWRCILASLKPSIDSLRQSIPFIPTELQTPAPHETFVDLLYTLRNYGKKIVLMLDEFDYLTDENSSRREEFRDASFKLRALASDLRNLPLNLIMSSRTDKIIETPTSPMENIMHTFYIGPFTPEERDQLLFTYSDGEFPQFDAEFTSAVAGLHPSLVQLVAFHVVDCKFTARHGPAAHREVAERVREKSRPIFNELWPLLPDAEKATTILLGLQEVALRLSQHPRSQLSLPVKPEAPHLIRMGLVDDNNDGLRISAGAFLWWIVDLLREEPSRHAYWVNKFGNAYRFTQENLDYWGAIEVPAWQHFIPNKVAAAAADSKGC